LATGLIGTGCYLLTQIFGIWGSYDLAKTKGYEGNIIVAMVLVGFCCSPVLIIGMPLLVLFGLEDKIGRR
jgi:ABC-type sulfate transport system permease subunit